MKYLALLIILAACSSAPEKKASSQSAAKVSNEAFKKDKVLSNGQVTDYYEVNTGSLTPALQDETLDRLRSEDLNKLSESADPLMDISIKCARKDFKGAFEVANKYFNRYQKVAAYWNQVANCHLNSGAYRKALLFYNKALEVSPNYVPALNNIGVMYSRQGQDQKALIAFERAGKEGKFSKTPRYNLGRLYLTYGLADQALPIFQGLLGEAENDVDLLNALGSSYFILSDYQRALSYYQRIPQTEWKRAEVGLNIALTLKKVGKGSDAEKVFEMVNEPSQPNLKRYYASVRSQLGGAE